MKKNSTRLPIETTVSVIKIGGSLLPWPELGRALMHHLAQIAGLKVILFGGGKLVDAIRNLDATHALPSETSHWLSIEAMDINAQVGASLIADARVANGVDDLNNLGRKRDDSVIVFRCLQWLRDRDRSGNCELEKSWNTTSDSIAAALAKELGADQLELLKSELPSNLPSIADAVRTGFVDACFANVFKPEPGTAAAGSGLQPEFIRFTNLRAAPGSLRTLKLDRKTGVIVPAKIFGDELIDV